MHGNISSLDVAPATGEKVGKVYKAGYVAIVGRANVGKSTLLNHLLCHKLSSVSPKPHTTRYRILGVLHKTTFQVAFLDTPGYLSGRGDWLDAAMVHQGAEALEAADLVILVVEARPPGDVEQRFMDKLRSLGKPTILAVNKIDTVRKGKLLPIMDQYSQSFEFCEVVPISAMKLDGLDLLLDLIARHLPENPPLFPPEMLTDRTERFLIAEAIREKVYQLYGAEIPYYVAVTIEEFRGGDESTYISATIHVDRDSQKRILIGSGGHALKEVGTQARRDIEELLGRRVYLDLWVKTRPRWRQQSRFVQEELGYREG